jgi:hypothetical protein
MKFEIDEKLAQDILNYLSEQKYKEVMILIGQLMQLKKVEEVVKE